MILSTRHGAVALTPRAFERYRRIVDASAVVGELRDALDAAELRMNAPGWVRPYVRVAAKQVLVDAWLVCGDWAVALRRPEPKDRNGGEIRFVTLTCCEFRRRRPKADIRQLREQAAEDAWAA